MLLLANTAMSVIGEMPFFKQNGLNPGVKEYVPQGAVSSVAVGLDSLVNSLSGTNYVASSTPQISQDVMPRTNQTSQGLFTSFVKMFYSWTQIAGYFSKAVGPAGAIIYVFTSFIEIIQLVGLFILLSKVATIAKLIIPIGG
jgi:hypothetical protein